LKELLENFWEPMFPPKKRMKGRRGIIVWWEEKVTEFINNAKEITWEKEKRDEFIDNLNAIDGFLGDNMEDAPLLSPLIKKIKSLVNEKVNEKKEESEQPSKDVAKADLPDAEMDADTMLKNGLNLIGKSASGLIKQTPFNMVPYRLNRIVAWMSIDDLPPVTDGKTMIPPPDEQIITAISTLYDGSNWEDLIDSCESKVKQYLFWLDLSRYVAEGMEELGHEGAKRAIEAETLLFVQRLKGIEQMCFSDGTPFADTATQEWIRGLSEKNSDNGSKSDSGQGDSIKQLISEQMKEAQILIKKKKPDLAIALLMEHATKSASDRERFLWKMSVCRVLINLKKIQIASSYIDDLLECVEKYKLEIWEPDNAIEALSLALTGLRLQKKVQHESLIESIIKKISMLDPITAMRIV
ncbi:MAG: type VI secretion system protein TssA, partial [Desulfobacteraceae bacterium]|nr:type VI secretion system protein TssA [Desulfobacteraceae bacterium]